MGRGKSGLGLGCWPAGGGNACISAQDHLQSPSLDGSNVGSSGDWKSFLPSVAALLTRNSLQTLSHGDLNFIRVVEQTQCVSIGVWTFLWSLHSTFSI